MVDPAAPRGMTVTPGAINRLLVAGLIAVVGLGIFVEMIGEDRLHIVYATISVTHQQNFALWYLVGLFGAAAFIAGLLYAGDQSAPREKMHWILLGGINLYMAAQAFAGLGSVVWALLELSVRRDFVEGMALTRPELLMLCVVAAASFVIVISGPLYRALSAWARMPEPSRSLIAASFAVLSAAPVLDGPWVTKWTLWLVGGSHETRDHVHLALDLAQSGVRIIGASLLLSALFSQLPRLGPRLQLDVGPLNESHV